MQEREQGSIKRFYTDRGFGFIGRTGAQDLFFHRTDVDAAGAEIRQGLPVEFVVTLDQFGRQRASGIVEVKEV